jgi:hypothetical protein
MEINLTTITGTGKTKKKNVLPKIGASPTDIKKASKIDLDIVKKAQSEGLKEGQMIYKSTWTPKGGYDWERYKFSYWHPIYGLCPTVTGKLGSRGVISHNHYIFKKALKGIEFRIN